jgi:DNA-binding transcriptional ArsR family regulator
VASDSARGREEPTPDPTPRDDLPPRVVLGSEALAALAEPTRLALVNHILAVGPCTASECAHVVGESASNCSWHLRALEKVGLVERAPSPEGDGRTRPWRATAVGYRFAEEADETPAERIARTALVGLVAEHANDLYRRHLERRNALPDDWGKASGDFGYALDITAEELTDLLERLDALIRPYVRPVRTDAPDGSRIVQVTLRAFPNPHLLDARDK